jgi:hypothetical protein
VTIQRFTTFNSRGQLYLLRKLTNSSLIDLGQLLSGLLGLLGRRL